MSSIPVSQLVNVLPGVVAAAGTVNNLNGLILTNDPSIPIGAVQSFSVANQAAAVGAWFGLSSPEYAAAQIYAEGPVNATQTPGALLFAQYPSAAVAGYLRSAPLTLSLTALQALSGTLTITVAGAPLTSATISLSGATSFSSAAALIQAGFTSPTFAVTYDSQRNAFLFASNTTGATETVAYATGTLAAGLSLTQATGASLSQGAAIATPAAFMTGVVAVSQAWFAFTTTWEPDVADKTSFSQWTSGTQDAYAYVGYDSDPNVTNQQGSTETWGYAVAQGQYSGSHLIAGNLSDAAGVLGYFASLNFTTLNGRTTLSGRTFTGLVPSITDVTSYTNLIANGYNCYGGFGSKSGNFNSYENGSISGPYKWADSYANQAWLRENLQLALNSFRQNSNSIPYNAAGNAGLTSAISPVAAAGVNFGAIATGVQLSAMQIQELISLTGTDISGALASQGWYFYIGTATSATRVSRVSGPLAFFYVDGQSIQVINLTAYEVQ